MFTNHFIFLCSWLTESICVVGRQGKHAVLSDATMSGVVIQVHRPDALGRQRAAACLLAVMGVCCAAFLALGTADCAPGNPCSQDALLILAKSDPDAPHFRVSTGQMYTPRFDPDGPAAETQARARGLKLEYRMQNVLALMTKGSAPRKAPAVMYNPSSDPDAPSTNDTEELRAKTPLGKQVMALYSAENKMDKELKLQAQVAELSPKFMPHNGHSMMLDLKRSSRAHITFNSHKDAAAEDDRSISKQVAAQTTAAESEHERGMLAREAREEKHRKLELSWMKHDWAAQGPPKKPGFDAIQKLVAKDMADGDSHRKIEADEQKRVAAYKRLKASYDSWKRLYDKYGTE